MPIFYDQASGTSPADHQAAVIDQLLAAGNIALLHNTNAGVGFTLGQFISSSGGAVGLYDFVVENIT